MVLRERIALLFRVDALIRRKSTGTPEDLACRLDVSLATTHRYIRTLKEFGAPVRYCSNRRSYYYAKDFNLELEKHCYG